MHTLATNVLLWMSVVLDESMKQLEEFYDAHKEDSSHASHGTLHPLSGEGPTVVSNNNRCCFDQPG